MSHLNFSYGHSRHIRPIECGISESNETTRSCQIKGRGSPFLEGKGHSNITSNSFTKFPSNLFQDVSC